MLEMGRKGSRGQNFIRSRGAGSQERRRGNNGRREWCETQQKPSYLFLLQPMHSSRVARRGLDLETCPAGWKAKLRNPSRPFRWGHQEHPLVHTNAYTVRPAQMTRTI